MIADAFDGSPASAPVAPAQQPTTTAAQAALPQENTEVNSTLLNVFEKLLALAPIVAYGVHAMKQDATLGDKQTMAQDALAVAIAGAQATVPTSEQGLVNTFGQAAQTVLNTVLTTLHNGAQPAPAAS